jgi:hypothetical protein
MPSNPAWDSADVRHDAASFGGRTSALSHGKVWHWAEPTAGQHAICMAISRVCFGIPEQTVPCHWQLLERGVRTATMLLAACDAESRWGAAAGAAVDEAAAAANRERVMSFAAAAASAAAMLLQRLQVCRLGVKALQNTVAVGSIKLDCVR